MPWWMIPSLWGIDVALVALSWGVMIAALFGISMLTFGPLLLLFGMVWSYTLTSRVIRALLGRQVPYAEYFRGHSFPMLLVSLCSFLATLWLLFFNVGKYLIAFFTIPLIVAITAHMPAMKKIPFYRELTLSASFVFACAVPSYYYSFLYSPVQMLFNPHLWCVICLFLLFQVERNRPLKGSDEEKSADWVPAGLIILFVAFSYQVYRGGNTEYEHHFYSALCIGAAALHLVTKMRNNVLPSTWYALSWGFLAIPALLGILLFAPETWFN